MKQNISQLWKRWKEISRVAMEFQAKIILGIIYFTLLVPLGIWFRLTHDTLRQGNIKTNWQPWSFSDAENKIKEM